MERRKKKILWKVLGVLLVLLIALRLALPYIVLKYVNKVLSELDGYSGHVDDIDIHLLRGAYVIQGLTIDRNEKKVKIPFYSVEHIDLSIQWKALFKGALVGEVVMTKPMLNFVASAPNGQENDWREPVKKLFPLDINRLEIVNGEVHYRDYTVSPDLNLYMREISAEISNLTNSDKLSETMVAKLHANGKVMKEGAFAIKLQLDPYADHPVFDMDARMEKMKAAELNDFFKAYGKFDVQEGTIGLYMEAKADGGYIKGYVKPIIENLNVLKPKEENIGPIQFVYEGAIEVLAEIFKNHPKDRIATRVEFSGDIKNPKMNVWAVITNVLRNAFIHVLLPGIDNTIGMNDKAGSIEENKKDEKKEKKKERKQEKKEKKESKKENK